MILLDWPWLLILLPLPLLIRWLLPRAPENGTQALRLPAVWDLPGVGRSGRRGNLRVRLVLAMLGWCLFVLAAARPAWLGDPISLPLLGRDLMLAVDVSGSMEQQDYTLSGRAVSRLDVVKAVGAEFIDQRRQDRLGLILFGSRAYLQTPLTFDRDTVAEMLSEAVVGLAGRETAIGDAIALAVKRLRDQAGQNRVLVLLTDGANTAGTLDPMEAASLAAQAGVRVYTIGLGAAAPGRRSPLDRLPPRRRDLDPRTLQAIAAETGGRYFEAADGEQLAAIYAELDRLEPSERYERTFRPMRALFHWPAAAGLLLTLLSVLPAPVRARGAAHGQGGSKSANHAG